MIGFRSCIRSVYRNFSTKSAKEATQRTIADQLRAQILTNGPITVAEYMRQVLTGSNQGYYMRRDVLTQHTSDFVTSPELNQVFGEMIAIFLLNEFAKMSGGATSPKKWQFVELGPGRGSLADDILRVFQRFERLPNAQLVLIEVSPALAETQANRLCIEHTTNIDRSEFSSEKQNGGTPYMVGTSKIGKIPVFWYRNVCEIPKNFTLFIAHEFFDAIPIHKLRKTPNGYREVFIDVNDSNDLNQFRFVLSKKHTPISKLLVPECELREHVEISPESVLIIKQITELIVQHGGLALVADYGHLGDGCDTFRGFKNHKLYDPLLEPGSADLTADVDFKLLKEAALEGGDALTYGPVTQRDFLQNLGIEHRLKALQNANKNDVKLLESLKFSYEMMTDVKQMGARFKFMSIFPATMAEILKKFPPVGFN